jgi:hypothetical protein
METRTSCPHGTAVPCGSAGTSVLDGADPNGGILNGMAVPDGAGTGWLVGRLWRRSLLGIYTRWLGLELPLRAATGYVPQCCGDQTKIRMEPERAGRVDGARTKPELMRRRWKARISLG